MEEILREQAQRKVLRPARTSLRTTERSLREDVYHSYK